MERAGFRVIFACATTACGGFDFRYAMEVLPEPQMHVDLGDFRYLVAVRGPDEIASLLVSTAPGQGFVQLTSIAPGALITDTDPAAPTRPATLPQTNPTPEPNPTAQPTNLAAAIALSGTAPLDDLVFASGSATLASGDYASLVALAAWLKANPDLRVMLVGHTDAEGALDSNNALSRQRATSVRARLIDSLGVEADQIDAAGAGYLAPRASNQTPEGRQINRRVEVMLTSTPVN